MIISCSSDFCNTFDFTNHIKANTCFKSLNETSIDVVLENWPGSFQTFGVTIQGSVTVAKWFWISLALTFPDYHLKL